MSSLQHILAAEPRVAPPSMASTASTPLAERTPAPMPPTPAPPAHPENADEPGAETPKPDGTAEEPSYTTTSTRRNASGSVSSVYSGNKIKHLKKEDGIPLWRKDIQYDFLRLVFYDQTKCFTKYSDGTKDCTFADIYIDAMAKSSKCSKILKEKLLQDQDGAICMAMVCLLVNVGRMNTTLNFFPEMRAQLRTYHSIPALQARQDPNAYKQLQDAPRLKSILKGATEDTPQPNSMEEIKATKVPRTNPVNLIFVMSQYAPKISEVHFNPPRDFFDLVMRGSLSSASRAKAFLWLIWWYLESDFSLADSQRNPFGAGQFADGEQGTGVLPLKVPNLESLTEEQAALENVDTDEEEHFGEVKRKERIAILASDPSPAMTALKRARREKGLSTGHLPQSDDEASESGWGYHRPESRFNATSASRMHETASNYTRSPSPAANRGFHTASSAVKPAGDMRIHDLLNNDDSMLDCSPAQNTSAPSPVPVKKGPGRGNWRRNRPKVDGSAREHVPLLPNTGQLSFLSDGPPATPGSHASPQQSITGSFQTGNARDHVPTPSYQAQKRHRGITQHQSAVINHRKRQIDYTLDRRIRKMHTRARDRRESEGLLIRAWKRIRMMAIDYDSEEETIKVRKTKDRMERDDDWRSSHKGKENAELLEEIEAVRHPKVLFAGLMRSNGEPVDVGEEPRSLAKTFSRCARRLERWEEAALPGEVIIKRKQREAAGLIPTLAQQRLASEKQLDLSMEQDEKRESIRVITRKRNGTKKAKPTNNGVGVKHDQPQDMEMDDDDGGAAEIDEEDREILGEVDADESDGDDEDEEMADD
ncbi:Hypothetical protein R9X50_00649100 [Acrodontium crateriforme]|uniref:Ino eighty subunit 1 n=1 Tax=Acrodontium crateriforme TaxID=150365 RepID=A0AAQ3MB26_9PEZI|nr:Hypothetical protein R9X50_00649100 [Acrodontium crateriforme]